MDDVLVIGEALVDIVVDRSGGSVEHPGGSPANVALGLARLGRSTQLVTRVGDDERGRAIRRHLEASGVRLAPGSVTEAATSTAKAVLDPAGVASYDFAIDWNIPAGVDPRTARAVHTGSIAAFLPPGGDAVLRVIQDAAGRATVSYDPNARPRLMGDPVAALDRVEQFLTCADVVKVSDEDLAWLLPGRPPLEIARQWLAAGPALIVVTLGGEGSLGLTESGTVHVPTARIDVVDTVGAGDAFMAGLLDSLAGRDLLGRERSEELRGLTVEQLRETLGYAGRVAAFTCTRAGAQPPTRAELDAWPG